MTTAGLAFVVDASTAIQQYAPEPLSAQAIDFFQELNKPGAVFHVPGLFFAECANIVWKKVQRNAISTVVAKQALLDILALPLQIGVTDGLALDALELALQHNISAYDACYVALARRENVPLITADQKLVAKLAGSGIAVEWLGSRTPPTPTP